jgi:gluconolactonase
MAPDSVPDGLKVDVEDRIYCTGPGGCWVVDPSGEHLGTIVLPEPPANLAWGEPGYQTLLFTARTSLYALRMHVRGVRPPGAAE